MKKISTLIILVLLFGACKKDLRINDKWLGHWVNKEFVDSIKICKNPNLIQNTPFVELIFDRPDSSIRMFLIGKESKTLTYLPVN